MAQTRQDNGCLSLYRESKMERFSLKKLHLKFSFLSFGKFVVFAPFFLNIMLYHLY